MNTPIPALAHPLRQSLLRSLARDLSLPHDHFAVRATMEALSRVSLRSQTLVVEGEPVADVPEAIANVSLETWCCVAACSAERDAAA